MAKKQDKKGRKVKKKDVYEVFKLERGGKEKTVKVHGFEDVKSEGKNQIKEENKILRNLLIGIAIFILAMLAFSLFIKSINGFEYKNTRFDVVQEGKLIFYKTSFPVTYQGEEAEYNIYIRNDPRKLEEVPFNGELVLLSDMVLSSEEDFNCDGDGVIAVANMLKMNIFGINIFKNESFGCDPNGRYIFVNLQEGNQTSIEQFGPACYNLNVNNCEILDVTERFMVESFVKVNENL